MRIIMNHRPKLGIHMNAYDFIHHFPKEELWRFFIDGVEQQSKGWQGFLDREPAYLDSIFSAAAIAFTHIEQPLNVALLRNLHSAATKNVFTTGRRAEFVGRFRDSIVRFNGLNTWRDGHPSNNVTHEGLTELLIKIENGFPVAVGCDTKSGKKVVINTQNIASFKHSLKQFIDQLELDPKTNSVPEEKDHAPLTNEQLAQKILAQRGRQFYLKTNNEITSIESALLRTIDHFNLIINKAEHPDDKLVAIVSCVQDLEQIHPFLDGNCRVFCMLVLNRLLLQNGFLPVILPDPNCFDGNSVKQLVTIVKQGMLATQTLIQGAKRVFGTSTQDAFYKSYDVDDEKFGNLTTTLSNTIKNNGQQIRPQLYTQCDITDIKPVMTPVNPNLFSQSSVTAAKSDNNTVKKTLEQVKMEIAYKAALKARL